ncbi:hypothetical protein HMPREF1588_00337 [Escherichia coli 110957]|nr:hypothetical protein HMPREF1588_00337 [Escherichia coli 110957]
MKTVIIQPQKMALTVCRKPEGSPTKARQVANIRNPAKGINNRNSSKQLKPISK